MEDLEQKLANFGHGPNLAQHVFQIKFHWNAVIGPQVLSMTTFVRLQLSRVVALETIWLAKSKIFTIVWLFIEKVC